MTPEEVNEASILLRMIDVIDERILKVRQVTSFGFGCVEVDAPEIVEQTKEAVIGHLRVKRQAHVNWLTQFGVTLHSATHRSVT